MKRCIDQGRLQAWFDEQLGAEEMRAVTAHLSECAQCQQTAGAMKDESAIVAAALQQEFDEAVPSERLRLRIDAVVATLPTVRPQVARGAFWSDRLPGIFVSVRPRMFAYASALAVLLLAVGFGLIYLRREKIAPVVNKEAAREANLSRLPSTAERIVTPIESAGQPVSGRKNVRKAPARRIIETEPRLSRTERKYEETIADLSAAIKDNPPMRPELQVEYAYNLALIDHAIATTRDVARKNPKDEQAAQFMFAAYQSKVDLMNQIASARTIDR
jgi:hypothetical protein